MNHPTAHRATDPVDPAPDPRPHLTLVPPLTDPEPDAGEEGSLVAEYGLLAVVAATVAMVLITWANSGALADFFSTLLTHARNLVVQ